VLEIKSYEYASAPPEFGPSFATESYHVTACVIVVGRINGFEGTVHDCNARITITYDCRGIGSRVLDSFTKRAFFHNTNYGQITHVPHNEELLFSDTQILSNTSSDQAVM
jgi:hypothetical protein